MAEGFIAIDPDKRWKAQLREGRQLFKPLGRLRDVQVQIEWAGRLGAAGDPVAAALLNHLRQKEDELKHAAIGALKDFDRTKWRNWIGKLESRARHLPLDGAVWRLCALKSWTEAYELHKRAIRDRSDAAYHRLRIGIKKFRYIIENFLPTVHREIGLDLKEIQDCLGEMHDLSVLWRTAMQLKVFPDSESHERWRFLIAAEKAKRVDRYRARMIGEGSFWDVWRPSLQPQSRLRSLALTTVEKWAFFRKIDLLRALRIKRLALQLFAGLRRKRASENKNERGILHLASVLQEFGRAEIFKRLDLPSLPGLTEESLSTAIHIVRGLRSKPNEFSEFEEGYRNLVMELCGVLRLARALARASEQGINSIAVHHSADSITILASGYPELSSMAEKVSRARYLLEFVYQKPIMIRSVPATNHHGNTP
jgi:CHAD domain-containing protein